MKRKAAIYLDDHWNFDDGCMRPAASSKMASDEQSIYFDGWANDFDFGEVEVECDADFTLTEDDTEPWMCEVHALGADGEAELYGFGYGEEPYDAFMEACKDARVTPSDDGEDQASRVAHRRRQNRPASRKMQAHTAKRLAGRKASRVARGAGKRADIVWYNRETGEVFDTREEAMADAAEQFDFGDPTNYLTYLGFPNDELPYIEVEREQLDMLNGVFGKRASFFNPTDTAGELMDMDNEIWDENGWYSGSMVDWDTYPSLVEQKMRERGIDAWDVEEQDLEDLTESNFHSLRRAIEGITMTASRRSRRSRISRNAARERTVVHSRRPKRFAYTVPYSDGWIVDELEGMEYLSSILDDIYRLQYEIEHCRKGSYATNAETYEELGEYVIKLADSLKEAGDIIREYEEDDEWFDDEEDVYTMASKKKSGKKTYCAAENLPEVVVDGEYCDGYAYLTVDGGDYVCELDVECWGDNGEDVVSSYFTIPTSYSAKDIAFELVQAIEAEYGDELGIDEAHLMQQLFDYGIGRTAKKRVKRAMPWSEKAYLPPLDDPSTWVELVSPNGPGEDPAWAAELGQYVAVIHDNGADGWCGALARKEDLSWSMQSLTSWSDPANYAYVIAETFNESIWETSYHTSPESVRNQLQDYMKANKKKLVSKKRAFRNKKRTKKAMPWPAGGNVPPFGDSSTWAVFDDVYSKEAYVGDLGSYWAVIAYDDVSAGAWDCALTRKSDMDSWWESRRPEPGRDEDVLPDFFLDIYKHAIWVTRGHMTPESAWQQLSDYMQTHLSDLSEASEIDLSMFVD